MKIHRKDLARRSPPAAWEAYFLIGIFPASSSLRWCKVQLYSGSARGHALAAVEGMERTPQRLIVAASRDAIFRDEQPLAFTAARDAWDVRAGDLSWTGYPSSTLECEQPTLRARIDVRDTLSWASIPRFLHYWTSFGSTSIETPFGSADGVALVEHAWGAAVRLDVARVAPRRWQWDVLRFEDGQTCAGLSVRGLWAGRSGGRAPRSGFSTGMGLRVKVRERDTDGFPTRWHGLLHRWSGTVAYEARASTPVAREIPDGGFVGFDFTGSLNGHDVKGTGFTELRATV
ncbi:MAG: hypothetical protein ACXVQY_13035 [Actinomycetota bacterium]